MNRSTVSALCELFMIWHCHLRLIVIIIIIVASLSALSVFFLEILLTFVYLVAKMM